MSLFNDGSRSYQDRFDTRRLADRIDERLVRDWIDDDDRAFIERSDMLFLATADADGRPQCSYKGGDTGFVHVLDEHTIAFPELRRQRDVPDGRATHSSTRTSDCSSSTSKSASDCA